MKLIIETKKLDINALLTEYEEMKRNPLMR